MLQVRFFFQWIVEFFSLSASPNLINVSSLGATLLGFRVVDAFADPIVGNWSDNLSRKNKSRKVLLPFAALIIPLGLVLCFLCSASYSYQINLILLFSGLFLFFAGYTLYCIPYWSLVDEFSGEDEVVKSKLSSLLGQGLFVATAISFVLGPLIVATFGILGSCFVTIFFSMPMLFLPAFCKFKTAEKKDNQEVFHELGYKEGLKSIFSNFTRGIFLKTTFLFAGSQMAFTIMTALSAKYVVNILNQDIKFIAVIMGPVILTSIITFFFVPKLKEKFEFYSLIKFCSFILGVLFLLTWFPYLEIGPNKTILAPIIFGLMGFPLAIILGLEGFGVVESAEDKNSVSTCFGAFNLIVKSFNGIAIWVSGIAVSEHFVSSLPLGIQLALTVGGLFSILPALLVKSSKVN